MNKEIKTLANCTDIEFLRQTNKIRHSVEKWFKVTDIKNIRSRQPKYEVIPEDADSKKIEAIEAKNRKLEEDQINKNFNDIMDAMLEKHPEETLEIIQLCCFVEPGQGEHHITYYMAAFSEMLSDENVIDFFQSLIPWARRLGLTL